MILSPQFSTFHKAYSPSVIVATKETDTEAVIRIFKGHGTIGSTYFELKREYFNGVTNFNISKVLASFFNPSITAVGGVDIYENLAVPYSVFNVEKGTYSRFIALNGVSQVGESSDIANGVFITGFEKIKKYSGYELKVAATNYNLLTTVSSSEGVIQAGVTNFHFVADVIDDYTNVTLGSDEAFEQMVDYLGNPIVDYYGNPFLAPVATGSTFVTIPIVESCTPNNPFYVRWINNSGGLDYWMFSNRQFFSQKNDSIITFQPYISNTATAGATDIVIDMKGTQGVKVGAQSLTENEFEQVKKILFSPLAEWFNEATQKWVTIIPTGASESDTNSTRKNIEIDFQLPRIKTQF